MTTVHPFNDLPVPDEQPDGRVEDETIQRVPRNRVFGAILPDNSIAYDTVKSNPSKAYRAMKRSGVLERGGILWEFVMTRRKTDVSSLARDALKNERYVGPMR